MKRILLMLLALTVLLGLTACGDPAPTEPSTESTAESTNSATESTAPSDLPHEHSYTTAVTDPTCTEKGYTTYTCACNDSYVDDYVDALGHDYVKNTCTRCTNVKTSEGLIFELTHDKTAYSVNGIGSCTDTDIFIPAEYNGLPVTRINYHAFRKCSSITSVHLPDSITYIGDAAFESCYSITSITLPNSLTYIGIASFTNCYSLASIHIPDSVIEIGDRAFSGCYDIIEEEDNLLYIGRWLIGCNADTTAAVIRENTIGIADFAFYGCTRLTSITIPNSVRSIGDGAFYECTSLTSLTIPEGLIKIDEEAFSHCENLTSITLPDSLVYIGLSAFEYCYSLASIRFPEGFTSIETQMFSDCKNLTSIYIPSSLTRIGHLSLAGCYNLSSIHYDGTVEQWNAIEKESLWNLWTKVFYVYCTDGEIAQFPADEPR